jgi:preprotein translocase subunit YajC
MTSAGFLGRIIEITDETVLLECGTAQLKMSRAAIGSVTDKDGKALQAAPKK